MTVTIENLYTGNGSTTDYSFTFPYLDTTDIKASLGGIVTTNFRLLNATTVQFVNNTTANTPTAPGNGVAIRIYRETAFATPKATFYPGSAIRANDLNDNTLQNLYVNQESNDKVADAWLRGDQTIISTESWHTSDDTKVASTKAIDGRIDTKIDTALTTDVVGGNKVTVTDNSPGSGQITVGVTSGSLVNSDINASAAIAGTKITPNFGAQNIITSGTVDGRDVSADGTKLDGIESAATADQTAAEIRTLVESASDSNVFTDADHSKLNAIEASATADQTNAEIRSAVEAASDSNVFTDADHSKLNAIEASATADQTAGEIKTLLQSDKLTANEIENGTITSTQIATGTLDTRYFTHAEADARYFNVTTGDTIKDGDTFPDNDTTIATTAAINDRIIDLVDDVGGFVPILSEQHFPNANPDVNNGTGTLISIKALANNVTSNSSGVATISNGTLGGSAVTITGMANSTTYAATFGMIVETSTTLHTYTFHRLVPKATEVTTVAGSISNVNAVGSNISNVNTVAGNNTNINTVAGANSNITTVAGSISNVNTVGTNISSVNDFAARYRVASSAPTSSLDTGDLYFDTSGNELKVYNGSAWQGGVTATGNLLSKAGDQMTGNLTFSGSQTVDGRDVSADGSKLDGIETGATADQTNAEIRAAVEAASDSNVFTDADHTKLNAIEASATADQTNAEIRAAVEAATDSNVFTDADHSKLNAIEASATADQSASEILTAIKTVDGSGSGLDADTLDGINGATFARRDQANTFTSSTDQKIVLAGSSNPYIRFQEGTTNKGYVQWNSDGHMYLWNDEHGNGIVFGANLRWYDGGYYTIWHGGNDGAGSGLDADTLDGVQGASYLRSDADDSTSGILTIQGHDFKNHNSYNLIVQSNGTGAGGICQEDDSSSFLYQLYGATSNGGQYGFLDDKWGAWDIKKTKNGNLEVDEGSGLKRVLNHGNVGSGGAISGSTVYVNKLYATNTGDPLHSHGWLYFESTTSGLYWNGGSSGGWYIYPNANWYQTFRSASSGSSAIDFRTSDNTQRGYVYADSSNNIGFLTSSGSWHQVWNRGSGNSYIYDMNLRPGSDNSQDLGASSSYRWRNGYFGTSVFDSKGDLRKTGHTASSSQYTFSTSDSGNTVYSSSGGWLLNTAFNSAGSGAMITIINNSGSDQTLTTSSVTLYNAADGSTGNRTLAARGMATIYHAGSGYYYITGAGLS